MISPSTNAPEHPEQATPVANNGSAGDAVQGVPAVATQPNFEPGMSGAEMLGLIFQTCDDLGQLSSKSQSDGELILA